MDIYTDLEKMKNKRQKVILAAGFFDGVHVGHQKVLARTIKCARETNGQAWCLTFDKHPQKLIDPQSAPLLLTSNRHKLDLLESTEIDGCLLLPFSRELAGLSPERFIHRLKESIPSLSDIVIGRNWRFGRGGAGCPIILSRLGRSLGFGVTVVRHVVRCGGIVSSTRIRNEVGRGNLVKVERMLGRKFSILGRVKKGRTIGRKLGFPTANIEHQNEVFPLCGVYAVHAQIDCRGKAGRKTDDRMFEGVLNMGVKPTFGGKKGGRPGLELHLFDFNENIYGCEVEVFFIKRLRNEKKFPSVDLLKKQIARDVEMAVTNLSGM